ncbi:MAG: phosphate acyltransferase PlsX [Puniceicoccales bacterium]|jgi:glycerol-3-phosphate acyltransferase PlsX|nr:phosphate acyltransferase PlsX [Puniceicoccales bacterium]
MDAAGQVVLAIDVMGSDRGAGEVLEGIYRFLRRSRCDSVRIVAIGDRKVLDPIVNARRFAQFRSLLTVFHAGETIGMEESPTKAIRHKKDASMVRAVELVQRGDADAVLSCGNTGALVALGTIRLRPMAHLERPALGAVIPALESRFVLLDVGANPTPTVRQMVQNALLGSHYCRTAMGLQSPRVGLLSIGTEEGKGNELVQETHEKLKKLDGIIRYVGLVEGFQLFSGDVDVVICDGFVGNVLLKAMEGLASHLKTYLKKELLKNVFRIFGCLFLSGAIRNIGGKLNPKRYGGAPLLGLTKPVFKAHGSSDREAIEHAITIAARFARGESSQQLERDIARAEEVLARLEKI